MRGHGSNGRALLVEHGAHFNTVLVPRIVKAAFAASWEDGAPTEKTARRVEAPVRVVKLLRLESYEESLNSLELPATRTARLEGLQALYGDEYLIRYMLPEEAANAQPQLNLGNLQAPFDYKLTIQTPDGARDRTVDIPETFNLVYGLRVSRRLWADDDGRPYLFVTGSRDEGAVLVIWRPLGGLDAGADKKFILKTFTMSDFDRVFVNGDSAVRTASSLDDLFKTLLLDRDRG